MQDNYTVENGIWSSVFAVPSDIVDKHLKLCGELPLKVLLVILRGERLGCAEIAGLLGKSQQDVEDAVEYWTLLGVLRPSTEPAAAPPPVQVVAVAPVPAPVHESVAETPVEGAPTLRYTQERVEESGTVITKIGSSRPRLSTGVINEMGRADANIPMLLQEAQTVLRHELTPVATDTLVSLYSYYGMAPDLILMLLQYCASLGKENMRYIEKVAATWIDMGVDSHEKAEKEILRAAAGQQIEGKIMSALDIRDRSLVSSEKKFVKNWTEEMGFGADMISLAYERTIEQKGKLSFAYLGGILASWHKNGVSTPKQALSEQKPEGRRSSGQPQKSASYDMQELEKLIMNGEV